MNLNKRDTPEQKPHFLLKFLNLKPIKHWGKDLNLSPSFTFGTDIISILNLPELDVIGCKQIKLKVWREQYDLVNAIIDLLGII